MSTLVGTGVGNCKLTATLFKMPAEDVIAATLLETPIKDRAAVIAIVEVRLLLAE